MAKELGLNIIPVINKIDLPSANTELVIKDLSELLQVDKDKILQVSAKTGFGVDDLMREDC